MNLSMAVVGNPCAGKTLFCINFAHYLGARSLSYQEIGVSGRKRGVISPEAARREMVHPGPKANGTVRLFAVHLLRHKPCRLSLVDTVAFKNKGHLGRGERNRLVLTLQAIQEADVVLHLLDLSCADPAWIDFSATAARQLEAYCRRADKLYLPALSKGDCMAGDTWRAAPYFLPGGGERLVISSVTGQGFLRMRRLLWPDHACQH